MHPLTALYSSDDQDNDSYNMNEFTQYDYENEYGDYRPLKVDKMEVDIDNQIVSDNKN